LVRHALDDVEVIIGGAAIIIGCVVVPTQPSGPPIYRRNWKKQCAKTALLGKQNRRI